jgi:hypothetical protein
LYGFPVVTSQETELWIDKLINTDARDDHRFEIHYDGLPQEKRGSQFG